MGNEADKNPGRCSRCGTAIGSDAPEGLCPRCLIALNLATQTEIVGDDDTAAGAAAAKAPAPPPVPPGELARHFPQLEILECLGRGGMGVVYKARHLRLDRLVALKILAPEREREERFAERFEREARALARLSHANIVTVYDFGRVDGMFYLMMEFVDGASLRQLLQSRRIAPAEALAIVPEICEALQYAHEQGVVHRDIKPENVLLDKQGRVKIADFGIAKILGQPVQAGLTQEEQVIGTPHYMAPEQIEKPMAVDHRADIYSLGVVFYEMLTGELPLGKFPPPSNKVQIDVRLDEVVLHALEKEPARRYQHAGEVKTDVETIATGLRPETAAASPRDSGLPRMNRFLEFLPGERVLHVKRRLWFTSGRSLPSYRIAFALPPFCDAALYVTDRRLVLVGHLLGLVSQECSLWFPGRAPEGEREILISHAAGRNRFSVGYLELVSEDPKQRWYRSRMARIRIYLRQPEALQAQITAARELPVGAMPSWKPQRVEDRQRLPWWASAARWTARVLGTVLLLFYGFFIVAEGLPPIASQPEGVQLNFVALGLMLLGFIVGWKRDAAAALLITAGWTLWHVSESRMQWNLFQTPLPVAALYAFCWWAARRQRTGAVALATAGFAAALLLGRLMMPTNVVVAGQVLNSRTGGPVANAELRLLPRSVRSRSAENSDPANARADEDGSFRLYVGWYVPEKTLTITARGFATLTTNLGPRALGERHVSRDFWLGPDTTTSVGPPPVVIQTVPESGATDVDPGLTELRATFSRPMQDGYPSWVFWSKDHPRTAAPARYLSDGCTSVLPVTLEPGKTYAVWLNSVTARDFKGRDGQAALPYLLIFETRK